MRLSSPLLWLLVLLYFVLALWWYSCSNCSTCGNAAIKSTDTTNITNSSTSNTVPIFNITDGNWNVTSGNHLRFGKSGSVPVLNADITRSLDSLVAYSKANPGKTINVTGFYASTETNNTSFENLGLARADAMKKWLIDKGIPANVITTSSRLSDTLVFNPTDTLVGGIAIEMANSAQPTVPASTETLFEPRTVYFNTAKNTLSIDNNLSSYLKQANEYLATHTDKKLLVTGHTDNKGDNEKNIALSKRRADFVKAQLVKYGIAAERILTEGKGPAEPVADNNTDEGRAKNRRATIQLQ